MSKVRPMTQRRGWAFSTVVGIVKPTLLAATKRVWIDGEKVPATGGCVVVINHISHLDPLTLGHFLYDHGRLVRYLAKDSIWNVPILKSIATNAQQIPVARLSAGAKDAYTAAVAAVENGECIGIYPEGTLTRDPDGWPMVGKTGAARIALETGCPVIPIGQWGVQEILPAYSKRPHVFPRHTVTYKVGDPVDLSEYAGQPLTAEVLHGATEKIMDAITGLVEDIRGEKAPAERFDPRKAGVRQTGNPNQARKEESR